MDNETPKPLSVSAALQLAKSALEGLSAVIVGEISEFTDKPGYKALYFTLSDKSAALPCVMWRNVYERDPIPLRQGMLVEVYGRFSLYAAKGRMNFDVRSIRAAGEGDLRVRVAALARKLAAEGLMAPERKRSLPEMPLRIGLVTSPHGKAVYDVLRTLRRRWPLSEVLLAGVQVEGDGAVAQMLVGLDCVQQADCDVILLVRGGGSYEDLMPFNDESLARCIAASPIPVVTGIGHEPDNSIADMVADFRASTPTAAAERVSPDIDDLRSGLVDKMESLDFSLLNFFNSRRQALDILAAHRLFCDPQCLCAERWLQLEHAGRRLLTAGSTLTAAMEAKIGEVAGRLDALSPLGVLARGYALAFDKDNKLIRSAARIQPQDGVLVRLNDGILDCVVGSISHMPE